MNILITGGEWRVRPAQAAGAETKAGRPWLQAELLAGARLRKLTAILAAHL
jgi:hypothetical protein